SNYFSSNTLIYLTNGRKVLISDKYFLFTEIFTISLQRIYVSIVVNNGFRLKGFTTYQVMLVTSVNYQKIEKQVI
ncbi:hypothetical protein, partial [Streptococcus salivarius]|uniref:hypothetical protein n=1 Tax=Streptococcus salivarius TaxID=1304 RepID=UPI001C702569